MAQYLLKCNNCKEEFILNYSVKEYVENKNNVKCEHCDSNDILRIISSFSSKVSLSREQMEDRSREEAKKIVKKIKSGDIKTIRDIYGEKLNG